MVLLWFIVAFLDLTSVLWACNVPVLYSHGSLMTKFCAIINIFFELWWCPQTLWGQEKFTTFPLSTGLWTYVLYALRVSR